MEPRRVVVSALISMDGKVTVADAKAVSAGNAAALIRAAVEHLESWWLEPALRETVFQVTYTYVIDKSDEPGTIRIQFDLPDRVVVHANPRN